MINMFCFTCRHTISIIGLTIRLHLQHRPITKRSCFFLNSYVVFNCSFVQNSSFEKNNNWQIPFYCRVAVMTAQNLKVNQLKEMGVRRLCLSTCETWFLSLLTPLHFWLNTYLHQNTNHKFFKKSVKYIDSYCI